MARNTILVIDDDSSVRRLVQLVLSKEGYEVIAAENGATAMEMLQTGERVGSLLAIICDLQMPRMNGVEAIERFCAEFPFIPILVLTGSLDMTTAVSLIKKGIAAYLLKPIDPDMLTAAVHRVAPKRPSIEWIPEPAALAALLRLAET